VHHALINIIGPLFERRFIFDSYANQVGKGTHAAIRRLQQFMQQAKGVLKIDLRQYFPSIDHAILKREIRRIVADAETLRLIEKIIDGSNPQIVFPRYRLLDRANVRRFARRMRGFQDNYARQKISLPEIRQSFMSWLGHARQANTWALRRDLMPRLAMFSLKMGLTLERKYFSLLTKRKRIQP